MSYEQELKSHYAEIKRRLYPKPKPEAPSLMVIPENPPEVQKAEKPKAPIINSHRLRTILRMPTAGEIFTTVLDEYKVHGDLVLGHSRARFVYEARVEIWKRLRKAGWSLTAIGRLFERDHSTVSHALGRKKKRHAKH